MCPLFAWLHDLLSPPPLSLATIAWSPPTALVHGRLPPFANLQECQRIHDAPFRWVPQMTDFPQSTGGRSRHGPSILVPGTPTRGDEPTASTCPAPASPQHWLHGGPDDIDLEYVKYINDPSSPNSSSPASPMMAFGQDATAVRDSSDLSQLTDDQRCSSFICLRTRDRAELTLEDSSEETAKALLDRLCSPKDAAEQQQAAELLCTIAADVGSQGVPVVRGGIPVFVSLLTSRIIRAETHFAAACALQNLSCRRADPTGKGQIEAAGGVEALLAFLDESPAQYTESVQPVLRVVRSLANDRDVALKRRLIAARAADVLVAVVGGAAPAGPKALAAAAIQSLSFLSGRVVQDYRGAVATLTGALTTSAHPHTRRFLMGALQNFSVYGAAYLGPSVPMFVRLLQGPGAQAEECAALVLHNLATETDCRRLITEAQAVPQLVLLIRRDGVQLPPGPPPQPPSALMLPPCEPTSEAIA